MDLLPNELLVKIFVLVQPASCLDTTEFFTERYKTIIWKELPDSRNKCKKYHCSITTSHDIPSILILCQVHRRWRSVVFSLHPFWKNLSPYYLSRLPKLKSNKLQNVINLSLFVNNIFRNIPKMRIDTISLCPAADNYYLKVEDLSRFMRNIIDPYAITRVYLIVGWMALGDPVLVDHVSTFTNTEHLYLNGVAEDGVLHGFSNRVVRKFAKSFSKLTHLFLDGMGGSSFNFKALCILLKSNPNLKTLKLKNVSGEVNLKLLHAACPCLEKLIIEFSLSTIPGGAISNALFIRLQRDRILVPLITGKLSELVNLKKILILVESEQVKDKADIVLTQIYDIASEFQYGVEIYIST